MKVYVCPTRDWDLRKESFEKSSIMSSLIRMLFHVSLLLSEISRDFFLITIIRWKFLRDTRDEIYKFKNNYYKIQKKKRKNLLTRARTQNAFLRLRRVFARVQLFQWWLRRSSGRLGIVAAKLSLTKYLDKYQARTVVRRNVQMSSPLSSHSDYNSIVAAFLDNAFQFPILSVASSTMFLARYRARQAQTRWWYRDHNSPFTQLSRIREMRFETRNFAALSEPRISCSIVARVYRRF